ncbi:MAG: hypothetical protein FVQ85_10145 [Planctomycetes bacterium]|nr:hypothetical protein [Planctomycetota bacterium]
MSKRKIKTIACLTLLVGVVLITSIVWAKATESPVEGDVTITGFIGSPVMEWTDEDGIQHVRGQSFSHDVTGDTVGSGTGVINWNLNPATGDGDEFGTLASNKTWGEISGTFQGRFSNTITGWSVLGHTTVHGGGGFEGMKMILTLSGTFGSGVRHYDGIILDPQGE